MTGRDGDDVDMDAAGTWQRWGEGEPINVWITPDVGVVVTDDGPLTAREEAALVAQIDAAWAEGGEPIPADAVLAEVSLDENRGRGVRSTCRGLGGRGRGSRWRWR